MTMMCENAQDPMEAAAALDALVDELPDPWEGEHDIEYWIWDGTRLVPASEDEVHSIREQERTRDAMWRLKQWEAGERRAANRLRMRNALERIAQMLPQPLARVRRGSTHEPASGASPTAGAHSKPRAEA
jgi:hypothetical protein